VSRLVWEVEFLDDDGELERIEAIRQESFRPEWIELARSGGARLHLIEIRTGGERHCLKTISQESPG